MSVDFQENFSSTQFNNGQFNPSSSGSAMVDFLIKQGIAKDAATANIILVVFSLLFIGVSIYLFIFGFSLPQSTPDLPPVPAEPLPEEALEF